MLTFVKQKISRSPPTLHVPNANVPCQPPAQPQQQLQQQPAQQQQLGDGQSVTSFYLNQENAGSVSNAVQLQIPGSGSGQQQRPTSDSKTPFIRDLGANYQSTGQSGGVDMMLAPPVGQRHGFEISFREHKPHNNNLPQSSNVNQFPSIFSISFSFYMQI